MEENSILLGVVLSNGYIKKGYGYVKVTEEVTNWVTIFGDSLQMYAYITEDEELDKIYDTGIVTPTDIELEMLIKLLVK